MALEVDTIGENIMFLGQAYWSGVVDVVINTVINMDATGSLIVTDADSIESHTISYSAPNVSDPASYFTSSVSGINIDITYNSDSDILPLFEIQYLESIGNLITLDGWGELPAPEDSPELKLMEENDVDHIPVTASVSVEYIKDTEPKTVSGDFTIILAANYNISADILNDEIDKRLGIRIQVLNMTVASFKTCLTTGHGCHPPQTITSGSSDTFTNNQPAASVGDSVSEHCCGSDCHGSTIDAGESSVLINGTAAANLGSAVQCGGAVASGSPDTFIGP